MSASVQPLTGSAASALIHELESVESVLGANPFNAALPADGLAITGKRISRAMARLRGRTLPVMLRSMNTTEITVSRSVRADVESDPLGSSFTTTSETVYAAVLGPTAETMANGFLQESDFEVIVAASDLAEPLDKNSIITIASVDYDVIAMRGYPQVPEPVAYRYWLKKVA